MAVRFSRHVMDKVSRELLRLGVSEGLIRDAVVGADEVLFDLETGRYVALKVRHKLAVVYEKRGEDMFIITAIYSSKLEEMVKRRKMLGRWV